MDEQRKPRAREKKIAESGKGVEKKGAGLGTGPLNNAGNYEARRRQEAQRAAQRQAAPQRPAQGQGSPFGGTGPASGQPQFPFGGTRPTAGQQNPFGGTRPAAGQQQKPAGTAGPASGQPRTYNSARKMNSTAGSSRPAGTQPNGTRATGTGGGGGKFIIIIIALVLLFGGGKLTGLFDGGTGSVQQTANTSQNSAAGQGSGATSAAGSGGLADLLSALTGSSGSSVYDTTSLPTGGSSQGSSAYFTSSMEDNTADADTTVAAAAREKYTRILGKNKDTVTILVYMCGSDLESQNGMGTSDLKEMANATIGDKVNVVVYTGGASRWRNNVVSSSTNQMYLIRGGKLTRLEDNLGNASMTSPETLAGFIRYGKEKYPANRMCLILWDHGGGSVSGFGYDEKTGRGKSMTLAGINTALQNGGVQFDFIGFDACLMATVENGIMLSQYADYMIASEETEPGVGWYYTNWLTKLSKNTSLSTVEIGKMIADDFVAVCNQKCRGQATTLSVVDLAELSATVPNELKDFSIETNGLIQNNDYKKVSSARSKTREFAQQNRLDMIDLVHFANNLGTQEAKELAGALQGAIKYNRTGGGISNAYGLSIYFPYKSTGKVQQMVSTYQAIGMDEEYTRCIQEFASLELSGQVSAGTSISQMGSGQGYGYGSLMESLMGGGSGSYYSAPSYTSDGLSSLLGGMFGQSSGGSTGSLLDLFIGRTMTADRAASYILENHFDASDLVWTGNKIQLSKDQWSLVQSVGRNIFYDDGKGYIDLGIDADFTIKNNALISDFDGTCLSIDGQPVAYYYLDTIEEGENYIITGYIPALLNDVRVNLLLAFDQDNPYGYILGAQKVYGEGENQTQPKNYIQIGEGDKIQFLCEYYDYKQQYQDNYRLGDPITLGKTVDISNTPIDRSKCRVTYCFTDIYQQPYWTPAAP